MEGQPADGTSRRLELPRWAVLVPLGLALLVFAHTAGFPFVDWDDPAYILGNPLVTAPLGRGLRELLLTPAMGYPQPVTVLTHHLDYLLGGGAPWPFHAGNLALHLVATLLVWRIVQGLRVSSTAAVLAAMLFALHPLAVEPVAWATGRKDLLAAALVLGGVLAGRCMQGAAGRRRFVWAALFVLAQILGLGCKPVAVVLVPLVFLDLLAMRRRPRPADWAVLAGAGVLATLLTVVAFRSQAAHGALGGSGGARFAAQHLALQLGNYAAPISLTPKYPALPGAFGSVLAMAGVAAVALAAWRRRSRVVLLGLGWFVVAFLPSSGLSPLKRGPADVYLYLPGVGLALLAALALEQLQRWLRPRAALTTWAALAAVLSGASWAQTGIWRTSIALWSSMLERYPDQHDSWWAVADALIADGQTSRALTLYETAVRRFPYPPDNPEVLTSLGEGHRLLGNQSRAAFWFAEAYQRYPEDLARAVHLLAAGPMPPGLESVRDRALTFARTRLSDEQLEAAVRAYASRQPSSSR